VPSSASAGSSMTLAFSPKAASRLLRARAPVVDPHVEVLFGVERRELKRLHVVPRAIDLLSPICLAELRKVDLHLRPLFGRLKALGEIRVVGHGFAGQRERYFLPSPFTQKRTAATPDKSPLHPSPRRRQAGPRPRRDVLTELAGKVCGFTDLAAVFRLRRLPLSRGCLIRGCGPRLPGLGAPALESSSSNVLPLEMAFAASRARSVARSCGAVMQADAKSPGESRTSA